MTDNNKLNKKNCLNNNLLVETKIKLKIYRGVVSGNIIEPPTPLTPCEPESLMFYCEDNSQYIPLL